MKTIRQLIKTERTKTMAESSEHDNLSALAKSGVLEESRLPLLKRSINKDPSKMTVAEKKAILELTSTLSELLSEAGTGAGFQGYVTDKSIPVIVMLKREAIRTYPNGQKIGLYYSQQLDKHFSIPFSQNSDNMLLD
jgi:hypothetical protein